MISEELEAYRQLVLDAVIRVSGVDISSEDSQSNRRRYNVRPRHVYFTVLAERLRGLMSLYSIAKMDHRQFDHATVLHAKSLINGFEKVGVTNWQMSVYYEVLKRVPVFKVDTTGYEFEKGTKALSLKYGRMGTIILIDTEGMIHLMFKDSDRYNGFAEAFERDQLIPADIRYFTNKLHLEKDKEGRFVSKSE